MSLDCSLQNGSVPVDIDVSPFDNSGSHKAGVSRTYKNFDGYAPIFAYIGTEGYLCNAELRENMLLLHWHDPQLKFLIKHNFRREDRYAIAEELKSVCKNVKHPREGKIVYIGSTWRDFETEKGEKFAIRMVYEITERTTSADGQEMLFSETEIDMYWTSHDVSDEKVIALYHNHAVCEQYHSEIKTDMGIERLPSGKFDTNALILKLTMIAYNILRIIGTAAMKGE